MGRNIFVVALLIFMALHGTNCQTIDEIILSAQQQTQEGQSKSGSGFDMFRDNTTVRVELDMLFDAEEYARILQLDMEAEKREAQRGSSRKKRKAIRFESKRWTNKIIPYFLNSGFSGRDQAQIQAAVNDWNRYTCLTFRPYQRGDRNYVNIQSGGGCTSYVGMSGGSQRLTLGPGCRVKYIIAHEMGHALGFHHEQTRPDRDQYVSIIHRNIRSGLGFNFQRHSTSVINDHDVPYDYLSIMHYGKTAFSVNGGVTIQTKNQSYQNIIGTRRTLSFKDVKLVNLMYKCGSQCGSKTCTGDGFVGKDCNCYCPGNPIQLCSGSGGTACNDRHQQCNAWSARGYCTSTAYGSYMRTTCPASCNACTTGGATPAPSCIDTDQRCNTWKAYCTSTDYGAYVRTTCPASCNTCTTGGATPAPTSPPSCIDTDQRCNTWKAYCTSTDYGSYVRTTCPASCNTCTTGGATPAPTSPPSCIDTDQRCNTWKAYCTSTDYGAYVRTTCPASCNTCTTGGATPAPTSPPSCIDTDQRCNTWKAYCTSTDYGSYVRTTCPASCNACTTGGATPAPTTPPSSCRDTNSQCPDWASQGECTGSRNPAYMLQYCKKSCQQC